MALLSQNSADDAVDVEMTLHVWKYKNEPFTFGYIAVL